MSRIGFTITITIVLLMLIGLGPLIKGHFLNRNDRPSIGDQFHLATLAYEAEQYEDAYRIMPMLSSTLASCTRGAVECGKMMVRSSIGIGVPRNKEMLKLN
jgi:hypothetical protein